MAATSSSSSNFSSTIVNAFIKKRLLAHGQSNYIFWKFASKDKFEKGNGTTIKFVRYKRLPLPGTLTEGTAPTADSMEIDTVSGSAVQRGQVVEITDVLKITMWHPVVKMAMEELAEGAARKRDQVIQSVLLSAANVKYGNGAASRVALASTDYLTSQDLRKAKMLLSVGSDGVDGGAKRFGKDYMLLAYEKHVQDLMDDAQISAALARQGKSELEDGSIGRWNGFKIVETNFGPHFTLESLGSGGSATTGGTFDAAATVNWGVTRVHKKRGFEEGIDDNNTTALGGSNTKFTVTCPSSTDYTYNVYASDDADGTGDRRLVSSGNAADAAVVVSGPASASAALIPSAPASGVTVYTSYALAQDAYGYCPLMELETFKHEGGSKSDPLNQVSKLGTKWFDAVLILNDAFVCRLEAPSRY